MKKKLASVCAIALVLTMLVSGCGSSENQGTTEEAVETTETVETESENEPEAVENETASKEASQEGTTADGMTIGISINALGNIHNRHMFEGLKATCEARGHEVIGVNANGDATQQVTDVENLIQAGCDVIVIQCADSFSMKNVVADAASKGIYVISQDAGWIEGCSAMVQLNYFSIQTDICMMLGAEIGYEGKIITTGHQDNFALRAAGYVHDAMIEEWGFEEVAHVQTTYPGTTEVTYNGLDSALTANPDVDAIFTSQDLEAMGAIQALKEHDLYPQVKCVGIDGEVDVLRDIKAEGCVLCTVISDIDGANEAVCNTAEKLMAGQSVQKYISVPYDIVTIDNVDEFLEKAEDEAAQYAE